MRLRKYFSVLYQGALVELPPDGLGLSTVRGLAAGRCTVEKVAVATVAAGLAASGWPAAERAEPPMVTV